MNILDVMTSDVLKVSLNTTIAEAVTMMEKADLRHLIVINDDGDLTGIVSDRDVRLAVQSPFFSDADDANAALDTITIERIMTAKPKCVAPLDAIGDAAQIMVTSQISALPVVRDNSIIGIVTSTDLLNVLVETPVG